MAATETESENSQTGQPAAVGVKLGSTRTVASVTNGTKNGVVETLTCAAGYDDPITGERDFLFGEDAAVEYPDRVEYMLRSGLPEDDDRAELAGSFFDDFVDAHELPTHSVAVYAVPTIDNEAGLSNLESVIQQSPVGSAMVRSYPESLCGAIPALGDGLEAIDDLFITVNMGSTNLEASAYRRGEQLTSFVTGSVSGNEVDRQIAAYVEAETQGRVQIDLTTAREYKETHADFDEFEPFTDVVQQPGGGTHEFTIERSVMDACDEYLDEAVSQVANRFLPTLASDYMKTYQLTLSKPIVLTGGMASIPGLVDEFAARLSDELQRDVTTIAPDQPAHAAAVGAQRIAAKLASNRA